jgi:hypothetical protein
MRNLKALGLVLVAVFAMGAIAASAASAAQFHSTATNTTITRSANATQAFQYETAGQTVECSTVGGSGEATSQTTAELTFKPTYSGCVVSGIAFSSAQVSMNNCDYLFTITAGDTQGHVHIGCTESSQITITVKVFGVSVCTLHIGKQSPGGTLQYANSGSTKINVNPGVTGISGTRQGSSECGEATSTTGSYTGQVQVKGEETGTQSEKAIQVD